jgi:hypothetical protein
VDCVKEILQRTHVYDLKKFLQLYILLFFQINDHKKSCVGELSFLYYKMTCDFKCLSFDSKALKADAHFCPPVLPLPPQTHTKHTHTRVCAHNFMELGGEFSSIAITLLGLAWKSHIYVNKLKYEGC